MSEENQALQQFDDFAIRHNAAMAAYLTIYEARNPRPQKEQISRDVVSLIIVIALAIVMIAAVIVSSSRTIDEFGGGLIGATAFVMIEGGIMAYAFFRARRTASSTRLKSTIRWATAGLILTFIVGLGANTDASLKTRGVHLPEWVSSTINILLAVSAPTLAFISSDVLAIELMATDIKRRESELKYKSDNDLWWEGFNRSWNSQQKNWGVKVEVEQPRKMLSMNVHEQHEQEKKALSPGVIQAIEWLRVHDPENALTVREAAKQAGISVGTMGTAKKNMRGS
jgi:hypothetical protein